MKLNFRLYFYESILQCSNSRVELSALISACWDHMGARSVDNLFYPSGVNHGFMGRVLALDKL